MDTQSQADVDPAPGAVAEGTPSDASTRATPVSSLLREIARAMQTAAKRERERIDAGMGVEETAQVEKIQARAADEAAALRTGADDDVELVNAWYEDETRRIREEADRRIEDRRQPARAVDHAAWLADRGGDRVGPSSRSRTTGRRSVPSSGAWPTNRIRAAIARLAGTLPEPPDLDEARAEARSRAMKAIEVQAAAEPPAPTAATPRTTTPAPERTSSHPPRRTSGSPTPAPRPPSTSWSR